MATLPELFAAALRPPQAGQPQQAEPLLHLEEAHHTRGNLLLDQGQADAAIVCFERAVQLKPALVQAHVSRGALLLRRGQLGPAVPAFPEAVQARPGSAEAPSGLRPALLEP